MNACYHSVHSLLSSSLVSKNIKMYRTIILPVVLYGCETWTLTLREECRLRGFENWMLRTIYEYKKHEVKRKRRRLHNESFMICSPHQTSFEWSRQEDWDGQNKHVWGRGNVHTGFWWENLRERDHFGRLSLNGRIILKWILKMWDLEKWTG